MYYCYKNYISVLFFLKSKSRLFGVRINPKQHDKLRQTCKKLHTKQEKQKAGLVLLKY